MLENLVDLAKEKIAAFTQEHPKTLFLGSLVFLAVFGIGSFLFGGGPINTLQRLLFPVRFVVTETGEAGDWYDVYHIDPPQIYDPDNFEGEVPQALIKLIDEATIPSMSPVSSLI